MATYETRTKEFGRVWFTAPAATDTYAGHVRIETDRGWASQEPRQICYGGDFRGNTVIATSTELKATAQEWLRDRRKLLRNRRGF